MSRRLLTPIGLGLVLLYVAFQHGGVLAEHWNHGLLALGIVSAAYWLGGPHSRRAGPDYLLFGGIGVLALVAFAQLLPLPDFLVGILSPERTALAERIRSVGVDPGPAALSVLPSASVPYFLRLLAYLAVFLIVRDWGHRFPRDLWWLAAPLVVVATLEATLGLFQAVLGGAQAHAHGTYINRNHFAGMLELALPFAVMFAVASVTKAQRDRTSSASPYLFAGAASLVGVVLLVAVLFSLSRMGFISAVWALGVLAALALYRRLSQTGSRPLRQAVLGLAAAGVVGVIAFFFLTPLPLLLRFADLASTEQLSAEGRLRLWSETIDLIAAYPLAGVGAGGYPSAFLGYKVSVPLVRDFYVHNDYLQVFAELGGIGFLAAAFVTVLIGGRLLRARLAARNSDVAAISAAALASLAALALHSVVDFNLYVPANAFVAAWVLGLASAVADITYKTTRSASARGTVIEVRP